MATATFKARRERLIERTTATAGRVDADSGVIRNVRILGRVSANGREYTREAIRQAAGLYEGTSVYVDHPPRRDPDSDRRVADKVGWLEHVTVTDDGLRADLHLLRSHSLFETIIEAALRNPSLIGLSHNATGDTRRVDGRTIVERVTSVRSVDLVTDPATTRGLFESRRLGDGVIPSNALMMKYAQGRYLSPDELAALGLPGDLRESTNSYNQTKAEVRADLKRSEAEKNREDSVYLDPNYDYDADAPPTAADIALHNAFRAAVIAVFDDDTLDFPAAMKRLAAVLKQYEQSIGSDKISVPETVEECRRWPGRGRSLPADERKRLLEWVKKPERRFGRL